MTRNRVKTALFFAFLSLLLLGCLPRNRPAPRPLAYVTVTPSPTPPPEDLTPYRQTMLPQFAPELDQQAAAGITRYRIQAVLLPQTLAGPAGPRLKGTVAVKYTNTETILLNQIYFRLFPNTPGYGGEMTITGVTLNGQPASSRLLAQNATLEVSLPRALAPGEQADLTLTYQTRVSLTADIGYGMYAYQQGILTLAGFYPVIPVFDNQGWHIEVIPPHGDAAYTDAALYDVTLTAPAEMVIVTTGDILTATVSPSGTQTIRAYGGPVRDFFIAMSADYRRLSDEVGGVTVTSYFPAGYDDAGRFVLQTAAQSLEVFSRYFGPYPYRAFDVVAAPMPATLGGAEFPGIIALARRYYDAPNDFTEFVTAHEVAHQWWYGLVGNDQVNVPWLDEALTQYSAIHYFEQRYGSHKRAELVNAYFIAPYNQLLNTGANRPVNGPVADFSELEYGAVVYGKGPLFFEQLRTHLGDPRYFAALRAYADAHRYGVAGPADLLAAFNQTAGEDIGRLYKQWILEK